MPEFLVTLEPAASSPPTGVSGCVVARLDKGLSPVFRLS
jgi:hypothetical protein